MEGTKNVLSAERRLKRQRRNVAFAENGLMGKLRKFLMKREQAQGELGIGAIS